MALSQLEITGAEVYATTIADELIARGNKVFIVSDTLTVPTKAEYIKLEFNKRSLGKRINHVKTLYKFIKDNGPKAMDLAKKSGESLSNKVEDLKKDERVGDLMNRVDDLLKK